MKWSNAVYGILLIILVLVAISVSDDKLSKYCNWYDEASLFPKDYGDPQGIMDFVGIYNTYSDAKNAIGNQLLKDYTCGRNIYLLVFQGIENDEDKVACYKYNLDTKELFKDRYGYYMVVSMIMTSDGDWYDDKFIFHLMTGYTEYGDYISRESGDIYYGVWYGDEIKNISFAKGKFEYSYLGNIANFGNVYFFTYELKDSSQILKEAIRTYEDGEKYYKAEDVADILGIKCKMTIDRRIIIYLSIVIALSVLTILVVIKTYKVNNRSGAIPLKILLWALSAVLSVIVVILIVYYVANPRLFFGGDGINEILLKTINYELPNAPGVI